MPSEYAGKDVAVIALDGTLTILSNGKQIAVHKLSYQKKDMVVNKAHYRKLTVRQRLDVENPLLLHDNIVDFPIHRPSLSLYDEVAEEVRT